MFNPNNPMFNQFGGFDNFQAGLNQFVQQFGQGMNPQNMQQMIQQKLNSGQISQQQFEMARQWANQLMGTNK